MKEITNPLILLNLNYQLIYSNKSIHCIKKESNNQKKVQKKFSFSSERKPPSPERKLPSPERKLYRLGKNSPENTPAPGPFSPERLYPRPSKISFSPGQKRSIELTCPTKLFSPGRDCHHLGELCRKQWSLKKIMQLSLLQSYQTCLR